MADTEKVINGLNKSIERCEYMKTDYPQFADEVEDSVKEAIQTIRELQSKSEEVCEWRMPNDNADEWTPSCEKNSVFNVFGVAWFKYCPYCGRKIKVVK